MLLLYYYSELHVTIIFHGLSVCLSVLLVRCLIDRGFCWRRLTLSVLFRLTASSRPGFPYSPFSSNALSSGAIAEPSPASVLVPSFGIFSSKLHTFRKTARWCCMLFPLTDFCYRSKICPGDEPGKQMASTEDPRKRKINCSWRELNPDRPVAIPTFYL